MKLMVSHSILSDKIADKMVGVRVDQMMSKIVDSPHSESALAAFAVELLLRELSDSYLCSMWVLFCRAAGPS